MDEQAYRAMEHRLWSFCGEVPRERRVRLQRWGSEVRVQEVGDGPAVLFLHGGPNAGSTWAPLAARLKGYRCLLVDRPGTGLSAGRRLDRSELAGLADVFVADVLDGLGLDVAHVVASSFGGYLALRSAAASPERVDRMVQMACPAGTPGMGMPPFMRALALPGMRHLVPTLPPTRRAGESTLRQIGHGKSLDAGRIPDVFFDWYLALQRHTDTMRNEMALIAQGVTRKGWDPSLDLPPEVLARVAAPTFFWWGADDTFGGEDVARDLVAAIPDAHLEMVPDAGHLPWLDDPDRAADAVDDFLSSGRAAQARVEPEAGAV